MNRRTTYYGNRGGGLNTSKNSAMLELSHEQLMDLRRKLIAMLRVVEGLLGCESSVKSRQERGGE